MRTTLPSLGLSLELPPRWREFRRDDASAAFCPIEHVGLPDADLPEGLFVRVEANNEDGLDAWAEAVMARHVRQGHPGWEEVDVAGSRARIASWTDGVVDVLTTFIVREHHRVLIELSGGGLQPRTTLTLDEELRSVLEHVLESVEWL